MSLRSLGYAGQYTLQTIANMITNYYNTVGPNKPFCWFLDFLVKSESIDNFSTPRLPCLFWFRSSPLLEFQNRGCEWRTFLFDLTRSFEIQKSWSRRITSKYCCQSVFITDVIISGSFLRFSNLDLTQKTCENWIANIAHKLKCSKCKNHNLNLSF